VQYINLISWRCYGLIQSLIVLILFPVWGEHSCTDCLLLVHILLLRTSAREKNVTNHLFVVALCCVQKCELLNNVLGMTQTASTASEFIPNGVCVGSGLVKMKALT
jgi:hypothetical protein